MSDRRMRGDRREPSKPDRRNDIKSREAFDEVLAEPHVQWDGYNYAFRDGLRKGLRKFREVAGKAESLESAALRLLEAQPRRKERE